MDDDLDFRLSSSIDKAMAFANSSSSFFRVASADVELDWVLCVALFTKTGYKKIKNQLPKDKQSNEQTSKCARKLKLLVEKVEYTQEPKYSFQSILLNMFKN